MRKLIPFVGIDNYKLFQSVQEVKNELSANGETYKEEYLANNDLTNPIPWVVLKTDSNISFFFANDKLFKIYVEDDNDFALENGIQIGMSFDDAKRIDPELTYDDWNEDWNSPKGYWLEDDIDNKTVSSITIFIKEVLDDDVFDKYEW